MLLDFAGASYYLIVRSGTEEQYNEIHQLLDDIRAYIDDLQQQSKKGKKKDEKDKQKATEFRDKAMETLKRSKLFLT